MQPLERTTSPARRTVLVVGANGFVGGFIAAALRQSGWRVLRGVRPNGEMGEEDRACDLTRMTSPDSWREVLDGVSAVVNAAGILRERGAQTFETLHVAAPLALARACAACGIDCFVQISSLGIAADGEFIASKHRFDDLLMDLPLRAIVLRPSVVYAAGGSYGGTSLLRALASFPGCQLLPGRGQWLLQPVSAEDVGALVVRALEGGARGVFEVGAPAPMTLRTYQQAWRRWMRLPGDGVLCIPEALVSAQVSLAERVGSGPVGRTLWRMLRRGNVTPTDAAARVRAAFGISMRGLEEVLAATPSQVQDRWHAQLYFLAPTLKFAVVALWLLSGAIGLATPASAISWQVAGSALQSFEPVTIARAGALLDVFLGLWLAAGWRPRLAVSLMGASVVAYSVLLGGFVPELWMDPIGGLVKNLVLLPALAVLWVLLDRR